MNRRNFLGGMAGILAAGFAPVAIGSGVLMPVRRIWIPGGTLDEPIVVPCHWSGFGWEPDGGPLRCVAGIAYAFQLNDITPRERHIVRMTGDNTVTGLSVQRGWDVSP